MKHAAYLVTALVLMGVGCAPPSVLSGPEGGPTGLVAATSAPCAYRGATTPYVFLVTATNASGENVTLTELSGSGSIGGCPPAVTTQVESVAITVCLQHLDAATDAWIDDKCAPFTKAWNVYWPYARQAGGTIDALCVPGSWRIDVRGGDGFTPDEWSSIPATFTCLELSGGD